MNEMTCDLSKSIEDLRQRDAEDARYVHNGLPSFLRASLYTASTGGANGYEQAGYKLGRSLESESPDALSIDEWAEVLARVDGFIDDDAQLMWWLRTTYPRIWGRVPAKRHVQFAAGVRRGREDAL